MPDRMDKGPACKTCKWWHEWKGSNRIGRCEKMHAIEWPDRIGLTVKTDDSVNEGIDERVVTTSDGFGCRCHSDFLLMRYKSV